MTIESPKSPFKIAKKRYRIVAFLIDFFIFWLIGMILGFFFGTQNDNEIGYSLSGLPAIGMLFCGFLLWPYSEATWGQTIGKRILKIKVVTDDYEPIGMSQAIIRFFLGIVDYMFFIGLIIAAKNKRNKRIGDIVADTLVIKIKKPSANRR